MNERMLMASKFKATCLAVLDEVERSRQPVVITKHGRPVARVVPVERPSGPRSTEDSVRLLVHEDEAYYSTGEAWDVDRRR
jgi:prevent-host-death family protein